MNWREMCGEKLVTPEQALSILRPTDRVFIAGFLGTPFSLCQALLEKTILMPDPIICEVDPSDASIKQVLWGQ